MLNNHGVKFVSAYQSRLYEVDVDGNPQIDYKSFKINLKSLGEYFAEGYRIYLLEPDLLMEKDLPLYEFIKELA